MLKVLDETGMLANQGDTLDGIKGYESLDPDLERNEVDSINEAKEVRLAALKATHPALYIARKLYIAREDGQ
jgi:hypothetical protein